MKRNCKNYFFNNLNIFARLSYLPLVGDAGTGYVMTPFLPFVILGFGARGGSAPNGTPGSFQVDWFSVNQNAITLGQIETLYQAILSANISDTGKNQTNELTFAANPSIGPNYEGYLTRFLNDDILPQNINAFVMPGLLARNFWNEESGIAVAELSYERVYTVLCENMKQLTDPRLWLPPGVITMSGPADPYFVDIAALIGASPNGESGFMILELKSIE